MDISSTLPVTKKKSLSIAEAIEFLEKSPQAGSLTQIAILVDFGGDARKILDHVNRNTTMMLRFYQGFGSEAMKQSLYKYRDAKKKQAEQDGAEQPATAPESKSKGSEKPKPESEGRSQ